MSKIEYIYCDSCVFIAYFNQEPDRVRILDQLFEEVSQDNSRKLITSAFSIIEVSFLANEKPRAKLKPDTEQRLDTFWSDNSLIEIVDFHEILARSARALIRQAAEMQFSLKPPDALHLVSAEFIGVSEFFTYDNLRRFEQILNFSIKEPYVIQPKLPYDE